MKKIFLLTTLILLPAIAHASSAPSGGGGDCASQEANVTKARDAVSSSPNPDSSLTSALDSQIKSFANSGCNFTNKNVPPIGTAGHTSIDAYQTPGSTGDKSLPIDTSFLKGFTSSSSSTTDSLPKTADANYTPTQTTPAPAPVYGTTGSANYSCGTIAAAYGAHLTSLTGSQQLTYKQGCSGANITGQAQPSADYPTTSCTTNQIGQFGLVQAAYANSQQVINTNDLLSQTPASSTATNTVASFDSTTGVRNEPGGCRLTSYSQCGQAGDIIMVQTSQTASDTTSFNAYMIYDGQGQFYYVDPNLTPTVRHGSLPQQYANDSYAATRLSCAVKPAATGQ